MKNGENVTPKWIVPPKLRPIWHNFITLYGTVFKNPPKRRRPLIIDGEPGVGKSMFIQTFEILYQRDYPGKLKKDDVKRVNVSALAENIFESEIFGHVRGAFTDAKNDKAGFLENTKLLILEEIGELSRPTQAKLLTFMEDGIYYRVGSTTPGKSAEDIQIIATTNAPLDDTHFRQDFLDRCYTFHVPALHERRGDILYILAAQYPDYFQTLSRGQILAILAYHWPGNMREIEKFGTTQGTNYCKTDFLRFDRASSVKRLLTEMGINPKEIDVFLNSGHLSLENDPIMFDVPKEGIAFKKTDLTFRYDKDFPEIGMLDWPDDCDAIDNGSHELYEAIIYFDAFMEILNADTNAKIDLFDVSAIKNHPKFHDPEDIRTTLDFANRLAVEKVHRGSNQLIPRKLHKKLIAWYEKSYSFGKQRLVQKAVGAAYPSDLFDMKETDLLSAYYSYQHDRGLTVAEAARATGNVDSTFRDKLKRIGLTPWHEKSLNIVK